MCLSVFREAESGYFLKVLLCCNLSHLKSKLFITLKRLSHTLVPYIIQNFSQILKLQKNWEQNTYNNVHYTDHEINLKRNKACIY